MKTIHKYPVRIDGQGPFSVLMPVGAIVRHIQPMYEGFALWAEFERPDNGTDEYPGSVRRFIPVGTGREVPEYKAFVGTITVDAIDRPIVFHVYEV